MKKLISFLLSISLFLPTLAGATTLKTEKHVSLINVVRTSTSTTYTSTADREPIWYYDADAFDQVTAIYVEANMRAGNAADTAYMILTNATSSANITGTELTTSATTNAQVRSADIKANLTDNTEYIARWKCDNGAGGAPVGTCSFDTFRIIVVQQGQVTKTETVIEMSEDNNVPSTSYAAPTDYAVFYYDSSQFDGTVTAYVEATLKENTGTDVVAAQLYDITAAAAVASSEVTDTGDTTKDRVRSGAITLTTGHEYRPDIKGTATTDDVLSFSLIIQQTGTPTKSENYITVLNTLTSGTVTTYVYQNRQPQFDAANYDGDSEAFIWEATLKTTGNLAYSQLYNETDAAEVGVVSTTTTSYSRNRVTLTVPSDAGNDLDHGRKIDTSGTVSVARGYLIIQQSWSTPAAASTLDSSYIILFE